MLLIAHRSPSSADFCAFLRDCGAGVFELDIQAAADGPVVSHFLRVTPLLPQLRCDGRAVRWGPVGAGAERLSAAMDRIPAGGEVLLDLKDDTGRRGRALADLVLRSDLDPARCYVSSRQWSVLPVLRRAGFRTWRTVSGSRDVARVLDGPSTADDAVTVRHRLLGDGMVDRLRRRGGQVIAWTVNDPDRAAALVDAGVDGITSDRAEVFQLIRSAQDECAAVPNAPAAACPRGACRGHGTHAGACPDGLATSAG